MTNSGGICKLLLIDGDSFLIGGRRGEGKRVWYHGSDQGSIITTYSVLFLNEICRQSVLVLIEV